MFSLDLFDEVSFDDGTLCVPGTAVISFDPETQKTRYDSAVGFSLQLNNENGILSKDFLCSVLDGPPPTYIQKNNQIEIISPFTDDVVNTGTISNDGESITFQIPINQTVFGPGAPILTANGDIIEYWDDVILTFTLLD